MCDQSDSGGAPSDTVRNALNMAGAAARGQRIVQAFLARQNETESAFGRGEPMNIGRAFLEPTRQTMVDPAKMMAAHAALWRGHMAL